MSRLNPDDIVAHRNASVGWSEVGDTGNVVASRVVYEDHVPTLAVGEYLAELVVERIVTAISGQSA